jgi:hypothetical protein
MAGRDSYTLNHLRTHARRSFEEAFEIIADPGLYNFESRQFWTHDGHLVQAELIDMTSRSGAFFGIPVWAYSDGIKATYYFSSNLGTDLTACASPISSGGKKSPENNFRTPFCYATASPEPTSSTRRANVQLEHVRELARERLALLVKFVFLLTNRIDNLPNKVGNDMLLHSKDLCIHVQRQKKIVKESSRKAASHSQDARRSSISARSTTIDADNTEGDTADAGGSQIMISEHSQTTGVAARNSKRVESDDDDLMAAATSSSKSYSRPVLLNH